MPQQAPPITYTHLISLFTTQLTVSIHTILAARAIYPARTFIKARAYNLPVQQSRHPGVCAWINDAVAAVEVELLKATVARVVLVIFEVTRDVQEMAAGAEAATKVQNQGARPLERYVWNVSRFPAIPKSEVNTPFTRSTTSAASAEGPVLEDGQQIELLPQEEQRLQFQTTLRKLHSDMHEQFRGLLARLSTISTKLAPLPQGEDYTYTLCVELKAEADPPIGHPQAWVASERGMQRKVVHPRDVGEAGERAGADGAGERVKEGERLIERGQHLGGVKTTPVRTVDQEEMVFEMWIEEGKAKFEQRVEPDGSGNEQPKNG